MKSFKVKFILISVILTLTFLATSNKVFSATPLLQDNFESQSLSNWQIITGSWTFKTDTQNNHWLANTSTESDNEIQAGSTSWTNYEFSFDILQKQGADENIFFRVTGLRSTGLPNHNLPVGYGIHISGGLVELQKWRLTDGNFNPPLTSFANNNQISSVKIQAVGSNIKIYINNSVLPSIDYTDSNSPILSGRIALAVIPGSPSEVWYDNILVTDLSSSTPTPTPSPTPTIAPTPIPTGLPSLNVPDIKQSTSPWGGQIYDTAKSWAPLIPYIKNWGCALTSADMVLRFYGFQIDPSQLNTWLNSQTDGYIGNGLVNWLAISRYTKINSTSLLPSLEFKWLTATTQNLIAELKNNRPAILVEPGHFVVAKSQTATSFGINDPGYTNKPTLASYNNTFSMLGQYFPSHTDLSYIMLILNSQFNLKVYDINGNEIIGNTFIQTPLIDDIGNVASSGASLKTFLFSKPPTGSYKIEVTGNGSYKLDSYLYDTNGNPIIKSLNGIVATNQIDKFQISIAQTNTINPTLTIDSILDDLDDANSHGKITKLAVYKEIKVALTLAKDLINRHNPKLAKLSLQASLALLKFYTPKYIDSDVSTLIQNEIISLITSL